MHAIDNMTAGTIDALTARVLFVTPHSLSTGEAITALHVAHDLQRHGAVCQFLASAHTARFLTAQSGCPVGILGDQRRANQAMLDDTLCTFQPNVVILADHAIFPEERGGVPLLDESWPERIGRIDAAVLTFDHLGLEQAATPDRMQLLLPCPMHEPQPLPGRNGTPFRCWQPPQQPAKLRHELRARYLNGESGTLVFHAVPSWAWKMAALKSDPFYDVLSTLLEQYLAGLPRPVTVVSINHGSLLPPAPAGHIRIVNVAALPVAEYEALLLASDLLLTENCFSSTLGKAVCAGVPAVAWHNSHDLASLVPRARGELRAPLAQLMLAGSAAVSPWLAFPLWTPTLGPQLSVLHNNSITDAFLRLEIFGGEASAAAIRQWIDDDGEQRTGAIAAQAAYRRALDGLPMPYQAVMAAAAKSRAPGGNSNPDPSSRVHNL